MSGVIGTLEVLIRPRNNLVVVSLVYANQSDGPLCIHYHDALVPKDLGLSRKDGQEVDGIAPGVHINVNYHAGARDRLLQAGERFVVDRAAGIVMRGMLCFSWFQFFVDDSSDYFLRYYCPFAGKAIESSAFDLSPFAKRLSDGPEWDTNARIRLYALTDVLNGTRCRYADRQAYRRTHLRREQMRELTKQLMRADNEAEVARIANLMRPLLGKRGGAQADE